MATKVIVSKEKLDNLANAINTKVGTSGAKTIEELILEIDNFQGGIDTTDATATSGDILLGKTAYVNEVKIEGTIETYDGSSDGGIVDTSIIDALAGGNTDLGNPIDLYSETILEVGSYAFSRNANINIVNFPNCESIGLAFDYSSIKEGYFNKVNSINTKAFQNCKNLETIELSSIETLNNDVFNGCSNLSNITIPNITVMQSNVFRNCTSLKNIYTPKLTYIGQNCFYGCSALEEIDIPLWQNVNSSGYFTNCTNLKTIRLGSINNMPDVIECINLTDVYINKDTICTLTAITIFDGAGTTQGYINIHVRPGLDLVNQYASATNWSVLIETGTIRIVEDYNE